MLTNGRRRHCVQKKKKKIVMKHYVKWSINYKSVLIDCKNSSLDV
jgi:hypothetical protein